MNFKEELIKLLQKSIKEPFSLEIPPNSLLGDYCLPCFKLSKTSQELQKTVKLPTFIKKTEVKGPYLNFFINKSVLAKETIKEVLKKKEKYGSSKSPGTIMIEFSQPNTHKAFHIGHIRGTSLGESLARIMQFTGKKVIRANYSGDTGMHIAKWIWCYLTYHKNEKVSDDESWIAGIYVEAVKRLSENEKLQEKVNEINRKIETKEDKKINNLWKKTRSLSIKSWKKIYKELGTKFDVHFFESEVEVPGKNISEELLKKGIAVKSEEAVVMDLKKYNLGVWILLRRDGTVLYSAKDIALAARKMKEFPTDKYLVTVGNEQKFHFQQLLKTLELMGLDTKHRYGFLTFEMVRLPSGKMSSRTGENIIYFDFKQELMEYAKQEIKKRHDLTPKALESRALIICIAALKYSMLKQDTNKVITFNKQEALNFEGDTGPYIQYTHARASSIIKKSKAKIIVKENLILNDNENKLVKAISEFPEIVENAYNQLSPHIIANYTFKLAQVFNEFYHECPVLNQPKEIMLSRLALVKATKQVLKNSLFLLGIEAPEQM